jgi:hypothetical protein
MFKKILICAPTSAVKNYCFNDWIDNVMNFKYPNFDIRLFDNTEDNGENAKRLNKYVDSVYGDVGSDKKFYAIHSLKNKKIKGVIPRITLSHNDCRNYFLNNKYDLMLHLETDIFPDIDIVENLITEKKKVIGAVYYINEGAERSIMAQRFIELAPYVAISENFGANEEIIFLDGSVKQVSHIGLGCVLIDKDVLQKIKFRYVDNVVCYADSYFAEDCRSLGYKIFAHTNCIAEHRN